MNLLKSVVFCFISIFITTQVCGAERKFKVCSPSQALCIEVSVGETVSYTLSNGGSVLLDPSPISVTLADGRVAGVDAKLKGTARRVVNEIIPTPIYRKSEVENKYNELTLKFNGYDIVFRAYDEGMGYRFEFTGKKPFVVVNEQATFSFPVDGKAYIPYVKPDHGTQRDQQFWNSFENTYSVTDLSKWEQGRLSFLPILVESCDKAKLCITESDLLDYPGMYLYPEAGNNTLSGVFAPYPRELMQGGHNQLESIVKSAEGYIAKFDGAAKLPWRVIAVSTDDRQLAANDLVCAMASRPEGDFAWVKPGKVAWDWWNDWNISGVDFKSGINNETYKYYIDFAAANGIEYVILDEGWTVLGTADLMQVIPEIDLKMLVDYAASKKVGIILWAGFWGFNRDIEGVCKHYSQIGVKGFKVDFMNRDDQQMVDFHHRAAQIAAKYKLMVDFHGSYKPAGINITYPNVINFEGVHGLEQMKWSADADQVIYDVTIPFIRQLAGPMDYTQGAMRNAVMTSYRPIFSEPMSQGTRCRQLAQYVVFESPLNMLCDAPTNYLRETESLEFIAQIPTTWDQTIVLEGAVGEYIVTARRKGDVWYVGGMTDWKQREFMLDLSLLGDSQYNAEVFIDGENAYRVASDYKKYQTMVKDNKMVIKAAPGGGFAMKLTKSSR